MQQRCCRQREGLQIELGQQAKSMKTIMQAVQQANAKHLQATADVAQAQAQLQNHLQK